MLAYLSFTRSLAMLIAITVLSACNSNSTNTSPIDKPLSLRDQLQTVADNAVQSGLPGVSLHLQDGDEHISVVAGVV
ncbi:MAG: Unknown protein, partial [uncultured Thiotrichaceae bacterium]